jgi:DNA-nicking Smr family endonuclease
MDNETDALLFRTAIGAVTPLAEQNRATFPRPATPAIVRAPARSQRIPDILSDSHQGDMPEEYLSNGLSRLTLRKLRRSAVQDSLDLHGNTVDAARVLLQHFLHQAAQNGLRCVRVIHGKGMNSRGGEAVLRTLTRNWLTQHPGVLAYCAATPESGGSGAVVIMLKIKP